MFPVWKLDRLPAGQRRRKLVLILTETERSLVGASSPSMPSADAVEYLFSVVACALKDDKLESAAAADISRLLVDARLLADARLQATGRASDDAHANDAARTTILRLCNHARNALLAAIGTFPAEWDLVMRGSAGAGSGASAAGGQATGEQITGGQVALGQSGASRPFHPGLFVYAEDIRSPFNLGSIFRTAEAFGAERVLLSPLCASASHPRAIRSAMGCVDYLPHGTASLADLPSDMPVFALETGGTPIDEFDFPERGVVIVGSEELGVSPEGLARATYGRVSIPMTGIKASLNVGVAFGILLQRWTAYLPCSVSKPF